MFLPIIGVVIKVTTTRSKNTGCFAEMTLCHDDGNSENQFKRCNTIKSEERTRDWFSGAIINSKVSWGDMQRQIACEENSMRASINRILLGVMIGCLTVTSAVNAQQLPTQHVSNNVVTAYGMSVQEQDQYVPYQPQAVYTNTNVQNVQANDPLAVAESAYSQQIYYDRSDVYPQFYGDPNGFGYQPSYSLQSYTTSYSPRLTCGQWFFGGWLDQGFTYNIDDPDNHRNGPLTFTDRSNEYMFNQLYLSMGRRVVNSGCNWDVGGRVDLLYGADYLWTSAIGLETHTRHPSLGYQENPAVLPSRWNGDTGAQSRFGLAMPQLYAEFYVPFRQGLNIKAGHFYSIMGYESVMSPQKFFYSHSYSMMYGQPMTHTGMLFSQRLTRRLTGIFGVTRGWDTWEDPNNKLSYLSGICWTSDTGRTEFSWVGGYGNETVANKFGGTGNFTPDAERSHYSMVLSHQLAPRLKLVTQHDFGFERSAAVINDSGRWVDGHWYSVSQYAFLQLTDKLAFGFRGEWFRDENGCRIYRNILYGPGEVKRGSDYWGLTAGFNWKPYDHLVIRPEARWDWSDVCQVTSTGGATGINGMYNDFRSQSQNTFSLSAYIVY